jgi:antitoxin ParD1/3/4
MGGRNFSLTNHLSAFVDAQVGSGRHQNASEVIREALRRYEDDVRAEAANAAMIEKVAAQGADAIARGDYTLVHGSSQSRALLKRLNARAARSAERTKERSGTRTRRRG